MTQWHKAKRPKKYGGGEYPGVRYREHATRKMDAVNLDQYYSVTYWWQAKTKTEGVGWASEGHSAEEAADLLARIKQNQKAGKGPCTLAEIREDASLFRERQERERREADRLNINYEKYYETYYLPEVRHSNKPETIEKTASQMKNWIIPAVGHLAFSEITLAHCKEIKRNLITAGRSPRTIQYVFTTFEAIWRFARDDGFVVDRAPSKIRSFKKSLPKVDNCKERFLTFEEEKTLLGILGEKSQQVHDMAIISIDTGLRWSEITALTWDRVDFENGVLHLMHTKRGDSRWVPFTKRVRNILKGIGPGVAGETIFKDRWGSPVGRLSPTYKRAVEMAGLNDGVTDRKMKISFHSLRHTFASRVLKAGASIYETSKLLGHGSVKVTERYSHVVQEDLQSAVSRMEVLNRESGNKGKVLQLPTQASG